MRDVFITRQFEKDLKKIPNKTCIQADAIIVILQKNPLDKHLSINRLRKFSCSVYRVRIGPYRLIYSFTKMSVTLYRFCHRKDVYRVF